MNSGAARKAGLFAGGVMYIDSRLHEILQRNYPGFVDLVAQIYKDRRLFNQSPVPLTIYLMADEKTLREYCREPLDGRGVFVPAERSIYVHAGGQQLIDGGVRRALVEGIAHAVMHDICLGEPPPWLVVGCARVLADGGFGLPPKSEKKKLSDYNWFAGPPTAELWRPALAADRSKLPSFEQVRRASAAEFAALGSDGVLVATAACYVLENVAQLAAMVWQVNPLRSGARDAPAVLAKLKEFVPRYEAKFADPIKSLFQLRPDIKVFLECELAGASAKTLALAQKNAEANSAEGSYWWQHARFALKLGKTEEAAASLERARECPPFPELGAALEALAKIYHAAKRWPQLEKVVQQQFTISILPTPTMHWMIAEAMRESDLEGAKVNVRQGLLLPAAGFEDSVERLRKLATELGI